MSTYILSFPYFSGEINFELVGKPKTYKFLVTCVPAIFLEWSSKNQETIKPNLALYVFSCLQKGSYFSLKAILQRDQTLYEVALAFLSN